jgi:hypothetical protein
VYDGAPSGIRTAQVLLPRDRAVRFFSVGFGNVLQAFLFYTSHQWLAGIPRADADRRSDDRKRASEQNPAPRRAGNDRNADAGSLRSAFVSLPAWLIDCFAAPRPNAEAATGIARRGPELRWHGPLFFV